MAGAHQSRLSRLAFSGLGTFLLICTLATLNGISYYLFARLDFSAGHVYSISSGTKRILSKIKDNIIVIVYFRKMKKQSLLHVRS